MITNPKKLGVAAIGLGKFGTKRLNASGSDARADLRVVADVSADRARSAGEQFGCHYTSDWTEVMSDDDVDIVVVSTSTRYLAEISLAAARSGKHVLCEKPFGRNAEEVLPAVKTSERQGLCMKVGYNHRYHPGIEKANEIYREGVLGRLHFMRCVYGHGGRPGYDREWRAQPEMAGGGQLLDQGVHILDLFRWFAGEFSSVKGYVTTSFWDIEPLEDNVFAVLRNDEGCVASMHASWTNWKNTFAFDVFGESGYLSVSGLGGYYGTETLRLGKRKGLGESPDEESFKFPGPDRSLEREWKDFLDCIEKGTEPQSSGRDAYRTLKTAEAVYCAAREQSGASIDVQKEIRCAEQTQYSGEQTR